MDEKIIDTLVPKVELPIQNKVIIPDIKPQGFSIKISNEELRKRSIFLATPMFGGMCNGMYCRSIADLIAIATQRGIQVRLYFLFNESLITRARNYCCDEFVRSGCTNLMFIDSDIGFDPNDVISLLAMQSEDSPYDIIGGPYPKKCISWEKIKMGVDKGWADFKPNDPNSGPENLSKLVGDFVFNPKSGKNSIPIFEPAEVSELGTGFMMIKRSVFTKWAAAYPQYMYKPDHVRTKEFDGSREIMMYFQAEIDRWDMEARYKKALEDCKLAIEDNEVDKIRSRIIEAFKPLEGKSKRYLSEDYWFCQKSQDIGLTTYLCPWMKLSHAGAFIFGGSLQDLAAIGGAATADINQLRNKK
jgi:hypothetical protein